MRHDAVLACLFRQLQQLTNLQRQRVQTTAEQAIDHNLNNEEGR